MIDVMDIRSVTEFQRNMKEYVSQLKTQKYPMVLTVNGRAALVVQNAASYQEILDRSERAEAVAAIRRGMEQARSGDGVSLEDSERRLREKHGFSR